MHVTRIALTEEQVEEALRLLDNAAFNFETGFEGVGSSLDAAEIYEFLENVGYVSSKSRESNERQGTKV